MSDSLLRQYEVCLPDGYPFPWAHETLIEHDARGRPNKKGLRHPAIKDYIRELAGHRCLRCGHPYKVGEVGERGEWSPCDEQCHHAGPGRARLDGGEWKPWPKNMPPMNLPRAAQREAHWRILTVHHLDEDKLNCRWWNLAALCQRCHLRMQRAVVMGRPYHYEHSEWFKPFAAGFYAWKYLGEELGREETLERLPQLLALEHRFTQETLL